MARGIKLLALAILWIVPLVAISRALHYDWGSVWKALKVPSMSLPFSDLRVITGGLKTLQLGGNPITDNVGEVLHRPMNYPRIWLHLFSWMRINDSNIEIVGILFCIFYLLCISLLILQSRDSPSGLILMVAGLSVAPLFAIERANTDLLIFFLVFLGCLVGNKFLRPSLFFAAAALKIYPFAALIVDALRRTRKERALPLALAGLVIVLFAWQWSDFNAIRHATPISPELSYGVLSLKAQAAFMSWKLIAVYCVVAALIIGVAWVGRPKIEQSLLELHLGEMFSVFGGIFVFTFAVGSNWDYRLIYLVPTLPMAMEMVRTRRNVGWGLIYIALVLVAENSFAHGFYKTIEVSDMATWALFGMLLITLLQQATAFLLAQSNFSAPPNQPANSAA